jgi:hypothetical protein
MWALKIKKVSQHSLRDKWYLYGDKGDNALVGFWRRVDSSVDVSVSVKLLSPSSGLTSLHGVRTQNVITILCVPIEIRTGCPVSTFQAREAFASRLIFIR